MMTAEFTLRGTMRKIHILKTGRHTDMNGVTVSFGTAEMTSIADKYNKGTTEAPITAGHPVSTSAPALGWVKSLEVDNDGLYANVDFASGVEEAIKDGFYKNVSASFYVPRSSYNYTSRTYGLRHVAILGAMPPAIKGLAPMNFGEGETTEDYVTFGEREQNSALRYVADTIRNLREWIIEKHGRDEADKTIPAYVANDIRKLADAPSPPPDSTASYSEDTPSTIKVDDNPTSKEDTPMTTEPTPEELQSRSAELDEREKHLIKKEQDAISSANADFCESLVAAGKLLPKDKDNVVKMLNSISGVDSVDFAEGEDAVSIAKSFLSSLPESVDFSEKTDKAKNPDTPPENAKTIDFAASAEQIQTYIVEQKRAGRTIDTATAQREIAKRKDG